MRILVHVWLLCFALAGCVPAKHAGKAIIDCITADRARIEALIASFQPVLAGDRPDWGSIEAQAVTAGQAIGGCALAETVQAYLAPPVGRRAPSGDSGRSARGALEDFRAVHAGGATFRTSVGNL